MVKQLTFLNEDEDPVPSEEEDLQVSLPTYETLTYPADYTLEVLVDKYRKGTIKVPDFQRNFVWTRTQSSKLIESFLLGLPVPPVFLFTDAQDENSSLVVDGQQRLKTIAYFFEGYFGEESANNRRSVFRLTGLDEGSPYLGLTYDELQSTHPSAFNKLNDSVLRAFVIRQLSPDDNTSIYHVFERLNTGGTLLHPQEIRNCIYHGQLNDLLHDLNTYDNWRQVLGWAAPQKRQRDVEMILRFLALTTELPNYEKPMKEFLNRFMLKQQEADPDGIELFRQYFVRTTDLVLSTLGERPFHIRKGFNSAVFDAVYAALAPKAVLGEGSVPDDLPDRYQDLVSDDSFLALVTSGTTDAEVVSSRIAMAKSVLLD